MSKAIINLPSIDTTSEFTEDATICDSLLVISENLRTALGLNSNLAKTQCAEAIASIKSIYHKVYEAKGNLCVCECINTYPLMYRVGVYNYLASIGKEKLDNELKDINDKLVEFIVNYRSTYTFNDIGETLRRYSLIDAYAYDDEDEYI